MASKQQNGKILGFSYLICTHRKRYKNNRFNINIFRKGFHIIFILRYLCFDYKRYFKANMKRGGGKCRMSVALLLQI